MTRFRTRLYLLAFFIFALAFTARIVPGPRTIDDSYITFRYARNILAGNGFSYNPGERVLGTTTPLYTILLTGIAIPLGATEAPFPLIALFVNAIADGITAVLLLFIGQQMGASLAGFGSALVWTIAPYSVTFAIGGLETSVYTLLLTFTLYTHLHQQHKTTAFIAGLSLLTRPDALLLIGPLALDRLWSTWKSVPQHDKFSLFSQLKKLWFELVIFLLTVFPWFLFANLYFGSLIPNSVKAKFLVYQLPSDAALVRLLQHYATPFVENISFGTSAITIGLFLYPFLSIIGARQAWRTNVNSWSLSVYPWVYFVFFAVANPLIFRWYLTPPLPFYFLTILIGLQHSTSDLIRITYLVTNQMPSDSVIAPLSVRRIGLVLIVAIMPFFLSLRGWDLIPDHGPSRPAPEMAWYKLEILYHQAADFLRPELGISNGNVPILAAGDVGVLGYYTSARILDTAGLISPVSHQYYPLDPLYTEFSYAIPPDLILDQRPDFIVILEIYGRDSLLPDPRFQSQYQLIKIIPTDIYGSNGMLIFKQKQILDRNILDQANRSRSDKRSEIFLHFSKC